MIDRKRPIIDRKRPMIDRKRAKDVVLNTQKEAFEEERVRAAQEILDLHNELREVILY